MTYLEAPGIPIDPDALRVARARDVVRMLQEVVPPYLQLLACRRLGESEADIVILDVEVERPRHTVHDIRRLERVAVVFPDDDCTVPQVLALRSDFPIVPHLNLGDEEQPRSLCLYDDAWREVKSRWTPRGFVERIRDWLSLTATGQLHAPDQPLEPLLIGGIMPLVLPQDILDPLQDNEHSALIVRRVVDNGDRALVAVNVQESALLSAERPFMATVVRGTPQTHGVIRRRPTTLRDLHDLMAAADTDLLATLRRRLRSWQEAGIALDGSLIIIVILPKTRVLGGAVESSDRRAFLCLSGHGISTLAQLGESIGLGACVGGSFGIYTTPDEARQGDDTALLLLNPMAAFSRASAAQLSGLDAAAGTRITAIGLGALGSQIFLHEVRAGWGDWTLIDDDTLLPHNLARHALSGHAVGYSKVTALAALAKDLIDGVPVQPIVADVLDPGLATSAVDQAMREADIVLDVSASVTVARALTRDVASAARRISFFLNPSGTDLVMLAEDTTRRLPLDVLEMQYYRQLYADPRLDEHLRDGQARMRYGHSCRDLSAHIPQDLIAIHAGIASRVLKGAVSDTRARIQLWRVDLTTLTVHHVDVPPAAAVEQQIGSWRVVTDTAVVEKVARLRHERLPNETGGILVGIFDVLRKIAFVADALPSPKDSTEWPTAYIRGSSDLVRRLGEIDRLTAGMLHYVGEWHSHPTGYPVSPSTDDRQAFAWLAEQRDVDGLPPLMLIVGQGVLGWYIDQLPPLPG